MSIASGTWTRQESDPQRLAILAAADRLLAGAPKHSTGNLSVVQLAVEAQVKYWVIAQRHTDLRNHFQTLARAAHAPQRGTPGAEQQFRAERDELRRHCVGLEQLLGTYATVINELAMENQALREQQLADSSAVVIPLPLRGHLVR